MYPFMYEDPKRQHKLAYYAALGKELKKKERAKEAEAKKAEQKTLRLMTSLEWFILGVVANPFVGLIGNYAYEYLKMKLH